MHAQIIISTKETSLQFGRANFLLGAFLFGGDKKIISFSLGQNCQFVDLDFVSTNENVGLLPTKSSIPKSFVGITRGEGQKPLGATLPPQR